MATQSVLPQNIRLIDTMHLGHPMVVASYLLLGDQLALVDPGPTSALPGLEAGLAANGIRVEDLSALLLTHIHFDHAGATGMLLRRNPRLRVYVHQRGAPHLIDPEKLMRSAARLYGDQLDYLWGAFLPVPAENVRILADGEQIALGTRTLIAYDAPGHASHHVLYHEPASGALWCGDDAGVQMPGFHYCRPATPPPDIDLEGWERTWQHMEALHPTVLLLTHFGAYGNPQRHIGEVRQRTLAWAALVRTEMERGGDEATQIAALQKLANDELAVFGEQASTAAVLYSQVAAVDQCWQGLARYWRKKLGI
ncbi:MAG: MBL fold metallo-hydrolase [Roseiflexaceae bacterium]|nr:MBL fold metallo-hydrolase [Roseiflexaceae bacterium]